MSLSAKPLGNAVAGTDYIVAIVDGPVTSRLFANVTYTPGSSDPTLGSSAFSLAVPSGETGLPQLQTLSEITAVDPVSGNHLVGQFKATLAPNAADVINPSSPMTFYYGPNAWAITASTSTG